MKFTTFATAGSLLVFALAARAQEESATATDIPPVSETGVATGTDATASATDTGVIPTEISSAISEASSAIESVTDSLSSAIGGTGAPTSVVTNPSGSSPAPPRTSGGASNTSGRPTGSGTSGGASQTPSNAASPLNIGKMTAGLGAGIVVAALL